MNQPPSCRIVAIDSRIGVNGGGKSTEKQPPSCRIVAIGSRIGVNGGGEGWDDKNSINDNQILNNQLDLEREINENLLGKYNSSSGNINISNGINNNNNLNIDHNNNSVGGNIQFPSRCEPDHSDQLSRFNNKDNLSPHMQYGEVRLDRHESHQETDL